MTLLIICGIFILVKKIYQLYKEIKLMEDLAISIKQRIADGLIYNEQEETGKEDSKT